MMDEDELLRRARAGMTPSLDDKAAMRARLLTTAAAAGAAGATAVTASGAAASASLATKALVVVALAAFAGVGGYVALGPGSSEPADADRVSAVDQTPREASPDAPRGARPGERPSGDLGAAEPGPTEAAVVGPTTEARVVGPTGDVAARDARTRADGSSTGGSSTGGSSTVQPSTAGSGSITASGAAAASARRARAAPDAHRASQTRLTHDEPRGEAAAEGARPTAESATDALAAPAPPDALAEESRLIAQARRALRDGDARLALGALDEHASRFPHGFLAEERDVTRIRARCGAGDVTGARRLAARFLAARPTSVHADSLRGDPCRAGE